MYSYVHSAYTHRCCNLEATGVHDCMLLQQHRASDDGKVRGLLARSGMSDTTMPRAVWSIDRLDEPADTFVRDMHS